MNTKIARKMAIVWRARSVGTRLLALISSLVLVSCKTDNPVIKEDTDRRERILSRAYFEYREETGKLAKRTAIKVLRGAQEASTVCDGVKLPEVLRSKYKSSFPPHAQRFVCFLKFAVAREGFIEEENWNHGRVYVYLVKDKGTLSYENSELIIADKKSKSYIETQNMSQYTQCNLLKSGKYVVYLSDPYIHTDSFYQSVEGRELYSWHELKSE